MKSQTSTKDFRGTTKSSSNTLPCTFFKLVSEVITACISGRDTLDQLNDLYGDEVDVSALHFELALFKEMFDDIPERFDDIWNQLKIQTTKQQRLLIHNVILI